MKNIFFGLIIFFVVIIPSLVLAECDKVGLNCTASEGTLGGDIPTFVGNIITAVLSILGVLILIFILYGGYLWMMSGGNDQMVRKAKDILTNAAIGLIIVLAAYAITTFVVRGITGAVGSSQNECATKAEGDMCDNGQGNCMSGVCEHL